MKEARETPESAWRLRGDITSAKAIVWFGTSAESDLRPEIHLFFFDRYSRLARIHERAGRAARATKLRARAEHHYRLAGDQAPPPAAALAMPVPRPSFRTLATGRVWPDDSNDAA